MSVCILGMGVVAPGAFGTDELFQLLAREPGQLNVEQIRDEEFPKDHRLPRLERMAMAAARQALGTHPTDDLGIVYGTGFGNMRATVDLMEGVASRGFAFGSPTTFQQSVHHSVAGQIAIAFGIRGPAITVTNREVSGEGALKVAIDLIDSGRCVKVLVVAADEITPCLSNAYQAFGVAPEKLGEGSAALLLAPTGSPIRIRKVVLKSHSTPGLQYPRADLGSLLKEISEGIAVPAIASCGTDEPVERDALRDFLPNASLFPDWKFFGRNSSAGLLRTVACALRLRSDPIATAVVHGIALGGAQSAVVLHHERN